MQRINLLPWREREITKHRKKFWVKCLLVILFLFCFIFLIRSYLSEALYSQQIRNQRLSEEITVQNNRLQKFAKENEKSNLLKQQIQHIYQLQHERNMVIQLFNLLPESVPQQVVLQKISMNKEQVTIEGYGPNNDWLTQMLSRFEQDKRAESIKLHSIVHLNESGAHQFQLSFALKL